MSEGVPGDGGVMKLFQRAHELGLFTILWCYLRNPGFVKGGTDYHTSADLTSQANHLIVFLNLLDRE